MKIQFPILILLTILFANKIIAQNEAIEDPFLIEDTLSENIELFNDEAIMNITLRFDITEFQNEKSKVDYLDAVLTYHKNEKDSINRNIRIKTRGDFRVKYCNFPPIRLNFKEKGKDKTNRLAKLKLVTHCKSGNENYLLKEYLIYKLYNALTDASFKVRLFKVEYINTRKKSKPINTYAFIIEPEEFLANRINAYPVELKKLSQRDILPEFMDRMAIFNYMIGNTDWSVRNQHNCKIFSLKKEVSSGMGAIVPYDFDYNGMVNPAYALPPDNLGISSVRERLFQGFCRSEDEFIKALKEFSDKKAEFYKIINEFEYAPQKVKKDMTDYLDEFYTELERKNSLLKILMKECKK